MSKGYLIGVYLRQEDADLREQLKGFDNAAKAEITKRALRLYFANQKVTKAELAYAPSKPWINERR